MIIADNLDKMSKLSKRFVVALSSPSVSKYVLVLGYSEQNLPIILALMVRFWKLSIKERHEGQLQSFEYNY
jgi:hypothetical protein